MNLNNPIFKMALGSLKNVMKENNIEKVIFYFDSEENPQIEILPGDFSFKKYEALKSENQILREIVKDLMTDESQREKTNG